jgi:hypothetical protein
VDVEVLSMPSSRLKLVVLLASLACAACGLFLDDFSKGAPEVSGTDDTDGDGGTTDTPCEGVDLAIAPWCNLEDSYGFSVFPQCDCPTCPWDATDCADGGGGDTDTGTGTDTGT